MLVIGRSVQDLLCVCSSASGGIGVDAEEGRLLLALGGVHTAKAMYTGLGGGAANAAVACARLGLRVGLVSAVGRDDAGERILQELKRESVDTSLTTRVSLDQTGMSIILLDEASGASATVDVPGANRMFEITEDVQKTIHTTAWVYLVSLGDASEDNQQFLVSALEEEAANLAFVPGPDALRLGAKTLAPLLKRTTLLALREEDAGTFLGLSERRAFDRKQVEERVLAVGPDMLILAGKEHGAVVRTREERVDVPSPATAVLDTLGAADAFAATFVAAHIFYPNDLAKAAQYAALNAASVMGGHTAHKGLLTRAALESRCRTAAPAVRRERTTAA